MKLKLNLVNIPTETHVLDQTIRQLVHAMLAFYLNDGLFIPEVVNIQLVPTVIVRQLEFDHEVRRTAELTITGADWRNHLIKIVYGRRSENDILQSIFHELSHLVRIINDTNKLDLELEEVEAELEMRRTHTAVEWLVAIFAAHDARALYSIEELHGSSKIPNTDISRVVRDGDPGEATRLPV